MENKSLNDKNTTIETLKRQIEEFVQERDWAQFHSAKNLSMAIAIEAAELMEKFVWIDNPQNLNDIKKDKEAIEHELIDVLVALLCFANRYEIDITQAFMRKLQHNREKYPVELAKGRSDKYTAYKSYLRQKNKEQ